MLLPLTASWIYFVLLPGTTVGSAVYAGTKLFTLVWPLIAVVIIEGRRIRPRLADWRTHLRAIPLGLVSGVVLGGAILTAYGATPLGDYTLGFSDKVRDQVTKMGILDHYVVFGAALAVGHSLIEEYYWRWYVFGRLTRVVSAPIAYILGSLAFAAHHFVVLSCYFSFWGTIVFGIGVAVGGAVWSFQYQRQRTLVGSWMSHLLVDAAIFWIGYRLVFRKY